MDPQTRQIAVEILNGFETDVVAGQIFGDTMRKPLSRKGAEMVVERLLSTGLEVVRATPPTPAPVEVKKEEPKAEPKAEPKEEPAKVTPHPILGTAPKR
jgi:hypothetical protein